MKMVDLAERGKKEAESIYKKTLALLKKKNIRTGHTELHFDTQSNVWTITVESEASGGKIGFGSDIEEIIGASKFAKRISVSEHEGHFDWAADTFIKPASVVTFKVT